MEVRDALESGTSASLEWNLLFKGGIEGRHWIAVGDDQFEPGPDFDRYSYGSHGTWGVNNAQFARTHIAENPIIKKIAESWEAKTVHPITGGFKFDTTNVRTELAALSALESRYGVLLDLGIVDDVESMISEFKQQAYNSGLEKIEYEIKT